MALSKPKLTTCLWFENQAEEAARFYCSVFKDSKIGRTAYYPDAGQDIHGKPKNSVLTVEFELAGMPFTALNGGPMFKFNEAISLQVPCKTQEEIDYYWSALTADGGQPSQCGWLKDKYGVSWQTAPARVIELLQDPDPARAQRAMASMMTMTKIDIATVEAAANG